LDPLEPELIPDESSIRWLKNWIQIRNAVLEAVFISPFPANVQERRNTELEFQQYVEALSLGEGVQSTVLFSESTSRKKAVELLVDYLQQNEIDFVVVSSHGRGGVGRWMMGSFAERLLAISSVPVLFLSDRHEGPAQLKKVLFPTDFSASSKRALNLFLEQTHGMKDEIILYHADSPPGAIADTGVLGVPVYVPEDLWLDRRQQLQREAERWKKEVAAKGFQVRVILQDGILDTANAIKTVAESESVDLIAMTSTSRGMDLVITGAVARQIFRMRRWPVWVCGPEAVELWQSQAA